MKRNKNKINFYLMILLLLVLGLGIGYAILTQQLTINNTVNYGSMKWDVGFTAVEDFSEEVYSYFGESIDDSGMVIVPTTVSLANDKKSISFNADFGTITSDKIIYVKTTVTNNSSFNVRLSDFAINSEDPNFNDFFDLYVDSATIAWFNGFYVDIIPVRTGDIIRAGESRDILMYAVYNELTEDMLFENGYSLSSQLVMNWEEFDKEIFSFKVVTGGGTSTYYAEAGMTWQEWVESDYNYDEFIVSGSNTIKQLTSCSSIRDSDLAVMSTYTIRDNYTYSIPDC
jgi:hypothetical protein